MRIRRRSLVPLVALATAALSLAAAPAQAVTGGQPDGTGHPAVAAILAYHDGDRELCSATLISPTVLLTAAHCVANVDGAVLATFASDVADAPGQLPGAADPAAGYSSADLASPAAAGYHAGAPQVYPEFDGLSSIKTWNDVGVVVLSAPVTGITPMALAPAGALDRVKLTKTSFTVVGYGNEVRKPESGPQKAEPMNYPLIRRSAQGPGKQMSDQILIVSGNANDAHGTGGTCFGDSGGPTLLNNQIVAVTSYTHTNKCRSHSGMQRVDLAGVQTWLESVSERS